MTNFKQNLTILLLFLFIGLVSCIEENKQRIDVSKKTQFNLTDYVINDSFIEGDVRRYGLTLDNSSEIHPKSGMSFLETVLYIAEKSNTEMVFQKGYYKANLVLNKSKNLTLRFNESEFSLVHIVKTDSTSTPKNINLKGTLLCYASLGIVESSDIEIDSIILKTNKEKNLWEKRNSGIHIYRGAKDIKINYIEVEDTGSGDEFYKNSHAALVIDGASNQPENVQINKIRIKSTDRHGIYITGKDHLIGDVIIDKFGVGSSEGMNGMQDAQQGEEKDFKALWVNKCYDSFIENITINEKDSKAKYTAHFDAGDKTRPFTIGNFKVINDNPKIDILEEESSGVVVEIME